MARVNVGSAAVLGQTHEGAPAARLTPEQELRRTLMACLLWEDGFYESGVSIADRLATLVPLVKPEAVSRLAIEARTQMHLRHAPLLVVREMARHASHRPFVAVTLNAVIQRADELTEFLALYWKEKKQPLSAQVKKGLARAFQRFNAYNLAKYNRDNPIKLRDVLFLIHAKPKDAEQAATWKQLVEGTLPTPDTWEVAISETSDKRTTWTRLLNENKLGALALIRNLRNMIAVQVEDAAIRRALVEMKPDQVLPFRFLAALRFAPRFAGELEAAMLKNLEGQSKFTGTTAVLVDVSGSMNDNLSAKSDMRRVDAAYGLAILARELSQSCRVFSFSSSLVEIPAYRGLALAAAIDQSQQHASTNCGAAVSRLNQEAWDRLIVITDEQSHDQVPGPARLGYMVNVASHKPGVGYGPWTHIDGWSDRVLDYVREHETSAR